jgi:hypothetical protein
VTRYLFLLKEISLMVRRRQLLWLDFIDEQYGDEPRHQIGGFPTLVQNDDMEEECHLVSDGVKCRGPEGYNSLYFLSGEFHNA